MDREESQAYALGLRQTITTLRAAFAAQDERIVKLEALRDLVLTETGEDGAGNMLHEPREALLILRNAARALLAPPATPYGPNDAEFGMSEHRHRATPPATKEPT